MRFQLMRFQRPTNAPKPLLITGSWGNDRSDRDTSESFAASALRTYRVQVAPFCAHLTTAPQDAGDSLPEQHAATDAVRDDRPFRDPGTAEAGAVDRASTGFPFR